MVPAALGVSSARELDGAVICEVENTFSALDFANFALVNAISFEQITAQSLEEAAVSYNEGRCDGLVATEFQLLSLIEGKSDIQVEEHVVLPERFSLYPQGPIVSSGDEGWTDIVRSVVAAVITAEELGITQSNVRDLAAGTNNPEINRLLGAEGALGEMLGLSADWAVNVIETVGNYGEIYERNFGTLPPGFLDRGLNTIWTDGGLLYAVPFR